MNSSLVKAQPYFEKNLKGRYCHQPFTTLELHLNGNSHVCCPSWNTSSAGEFMKSDIQDIWNSPTILDIRASIIDGSYKYCDKSACPYIQGEFLPFYNGLSERMKNYIDNKLVYLETPPENVMFTFDSSCNLSCPTCRSEKVSHTINSSEYKSLNDLCHKISNSLLTDPLAKLSINITGSGDPFSSLAFRHYLESIDGSKHPNLTFHLQTNGLLLTPIMWERLAKIHNNIEQIYVSIDAATSETYAIVRRGGSFHTLIENMKFICQLRADKKIDHLQANFVVQQKNYREIPAFAEMFSKMDCDSVFFSKVFDWGVWSKEDFAANCIWDDLHIDYDHFISVLADPILAHPKVSLGNILPYRTLAIERRLSSMSWLEKTKYKSEHLLRTKKNNLIKKIKKLIKNFN